MCVRPMSALSLWWGLLCSIFQCFVVAVLILDHNCRRQEKGEGKRALMSAKSSSWCGVFKIPHQLTAKGVGGVGRTGDPRTAPALHCMSRGGQCTDKRAKRSVRRKTKRRSVTTVVHVGVSVQLLVQHFHISLFADDEEPVQSLCSTICLLHECAITHK